MFLPNDPNAPLNETANCRCGVKYVREGDIPVSPVVKITRNIHNNKEKIILIGGRFITVRVQNFQTFVAPLRITLASFPLDENGNQITVFQNVPVPFTGLIPPIIPLTFDFDAGPVGVSFRHVLIAEPDSKASGAEIFVNVTLEARD